MNKNLGLVLIICGIVMNPLKLTLHKISLLLVCLLLSFATSGCKHTANGAGQDIEKMGEKIQEKTSP
jgi:predicted small secreted protein